MAANLDRFRLFAPDENSSNRLQDVMKVADRTWNAETVPYDDHLAADGRIGLACARRVGIMTGLLGAPPSQAVKDLGCDLELLQPTSIPVPE